jgi:hypothetical protein
MTGSNDDRLLADIEKLVKSKLPVEDLAVDAGPRPMRREGRSERPARSESAERIVPQPEVTERAPQPEAAERAPRAEPAERAPRTERPERDTERPRRSRERDDDRSARARPTVPPAAPRLRDDPFFSKPYEPDVGVAGQTADAAATEAARPAPRRGARPVAALLGGGKKA